MLRCYGGGINNPMGKVKIEWSANFAYAIGLLVTDGCLSSSQRHISLVSKDREMLENFKQCLNINNKISDHHSGSGFTNLRVQFGDIAFYKFLNSIGVMARKTKIIGAVDIPDEYFFDFLRGHHDGDGTFYSYWDPRWRSSYMFYTVFISASEGHVLWLREEMFKRLGIRGHFTKTGSTPICSLKYAKAESLKLLPRMYYNPEVVCLSRKRKKIEKGLAVINKKLAE
jgi:LAGLIDADG-like domain